MQDYQINNLLEQRNVAADRGKMDIANHLNSRIIRYLSRLLFAIGWDKLHPFAVQEMNQLLVSKLFSEQHDPKKYSVESGTMGMILKNCAKIAHKEDLVKSEIDLMCVIGDVRNIDAHQEYSREEIWGLTSEKLQILDLYFKDKECAYLVPTQTLQDGWIQCLCYTADKEYPHTIMVPPEEAFDWGKKENHVFYRIFDTITGKSSYHSLSPFIEQPEDDFMPNRLFLYYDQVANKGYGGDFWTLRYNTCEGCKTQCVERSYQILVLFQQNPNQNSKWITSPTTNLCINFSQYPGYENIQREVYPYCPEICPIKEDVIDFCKNDCQQTAFVSGNGGVGKTALMLSVISLLFRNDSMKYTNLIFLTAKLQYIELSSSQYSTENITPDIHNYEELIDRLAELTDCEDPDIPKDQLAQCIIDQINQSRSRFLLIIDDLDSLGIAERQKIDRFVHQFKAEKLKTVITTRTIQPEGATSFHLKELDREKSLLFAKWCYHRYYERKLPANKGNLSDHDWKNAEQWVEELGEGNPLIIQMLIGLVMEGKETYFKAPRTRMERCQYRYNTVQNILNENEQIVFQICIQIYEKLKDDNRSEELSDCIPQLLAVGCGIDENTFKEAKKKLMRLKLLVCSRNDSFKVFPDYFITTEDNKKTNQKPIRLKTKPLPKMYRYVWSSIQADPISWFGWDIASRLAKLLLEKQDEPYFDIVTARTIFEEMIRIDLLPAKMKEKAEEWINIHTLTGDDIDNGSEDELDLRRMSELENKWEKMKYDHEQTGGFDISAVTQLVYDVGNLKAQNTAPALSKRCEAILKDAAYYGFE